MSQKLSSEETRVSPEEPVVAPVSESGSLRRIRYTVHESPDCLIYDRSEKPQIYLYDVYDGGITHHTKLTNHVIGFVLEGSISITFPDKARHLHRKGQMLFMPSGSIFTWNFQEYTQLLVYRLHNPGFRLCEKFPVESLYVEDSKYLWPEQGSQETKPKERFSMLKIHPGLLQRLESVRDCFTDGIRCKKFFEMEIEAFFILIRCYYDKKELYSFMRFIMTGNMVFTEYVRLRWKEYYTVSELASSMSMSAKHFSRQFVQFFGQRPSVWMANNRARLIFDELTASNKPLKQIAFDNGFSSISQFSIFTKKMLGKNATEIRNGEGAYPDN
ncbi:MAG: helix-turn-helix domain-containing protein [Bacteroidales bacterium]|jgi:AraC-like DNA-binding protein|nr:helix-turn-helix domain-containing protein [Bacteroidales bacterium]